MTGRPPNRDGPGERGARLVLSLASLLVPAHRRAAWREEWEAELWHHLRGRTGSGVHPSPIQLMTRCLGAVPHAIAIRRGEGGDMGTYVQAMKLGVRRLVRDPAFSVPAVVVCGVAVAAAATIFSSYEAVVLRELTYREPSTLVSVWAEHAERGWHQEYVAPANMFDWREQVAAFDDVAAYADYIWEQILIEEGEAEVVDGSPVTGNILDVLGVQPALGRGFRMEETWSDADPVTVLGHGFWVRRFGADPDVIGRSLELSGVGYEVIGVLPADFRYLVPERDLLLPFRWDPEARGQTFFRRAHLARTVARLAPGATIADAESQLRVVADRLASAYPATNEGLSAGITPLAEYQVGDRGVTLRALLGGVGVLLLAACVNVGYLILLRRTRRRRELAIQRALGARPGILLRDAAIEGTLLSAAAAAVGLACSVLGMRALGALAPPELLASADLRLSGPLLASAIGVMAVVAVLFTVISARASGGAGEGVLVDRRTGSELGVRGGRAVHGFVVLQIALSAVLIFSAVLLARSFVALRSVDAGFEAAGVLSFAVPFPDASAETDGARVATARALMDELEGVGGVVSVGAVRELPIQGNGWTSMFSVRGAPDDFSSFEIAHRGADNGYFETMRVPVVRGRLFLADEADALVVNETFARRAFGDEDPLGRFVAFTEEPGDGSPWFRIVGVVGNERQNGLRAEVMPEVITHYADFDTPGTFRFVVRTTSEPSSLVPAARAVLREVDPGLPMDEVATLEEIVRSSLARERFLTLLAGAFAALAAFLAVVGVYGVTAQLAEGWRREFAVRLAVGAAPGSLFLAVMTRAAVIVGGGLVVGTGGSLLVARLVSAFLYGTGPADPATVAIAAALVTASGLAAALPPALRAMRTDPARSLAT